MPFLRSGQGDQRRRRVLIEEHRSDSVAAKETTAAQTESAERRGPSAKTLAYSAAALTDHQPSVMVLIPRRPWTLAVILLVGLSVIAALEAAYGSLLLWPRELWPCACRSLDLRARGELAAYFSMTLLAGAAIQSLLIYRLRRHRLDDYRGRYRLWTWLPLVWIGMGLGVCTHAGDDLADLTVRLAGTDASQANAVWAPLILGIAWLMIGARLALEIRRARISMAFLAIATCCYLTTNVVGAGWLAPASEILQAMTTSAAAMLGHLATFMAITSYSRHVYREAHGMLADRSRKTTVKRKRASASDKVEASSKRSKPAPAEPAAKTIATSDRQEKQGEVPNVVAERKSPETSAKPQPQPAAASRPAAEPRTGTNGTASPQASAPVAPRPATPPPTKAGTSRPVPVPVATDDDDDVADDAADDDNEQLSRNERRRLRKLGRRDSQGRRAA